MKKYILFIVILFFFSASLTAQTSSLSIGSETVCAVQEVLIPVTASDLNNVSAITLFIGFDTTLLQFKNIINVDSLIVGYSWNIISNPIQLGFVWAGVTPLNLSHKKLFDLKFNFLGLPAPVTFNSGCELIDKALQIIPVNLVNGSVHEGNISLTTNPHDTLVNTGMNTRFTVFSPNALSFRWKVSSNQGSSWTEIQDNFHYYGSRTNQLNISQVPFSFNNNLYFCAMDNGFCELNSPSAILHVDSTLSISDQLTQKIHLDQNYPNPFSVETMINYNLPQEGAVKINIYNYTGIEVLSFPGQWQSAGAHSMNINVPELNSGLYFYNLEVTNQNYLRSAFKKMIKY